VEESMIKDIKPEKEKTTA